jgi:homogentisate 1,2-dioxygenase
MNELMGLIHGEYDAKKEGFLKGGASIHNRMTPHGPDYASYISAITKELSPEYINSLAFMFEAKELWQITEQANQHSSRQDEYIKCWDNFKVNFGTNLSN